MTKMTEKQKVEQGLCIKKYKIEFTLEGKILHDGFPFIIYHIKKELLWTFNRLTQLRLFNSSGIYTKVSDLKIKRLNKE